MFRDHRSTRANGRCRRLPSPRRARHDGPEARSSSLARGLPSPDRSPATVRFVRLAFALPLWWPLDVCAQIGNSEALVNLISAPGGAGLGWLVSSERSPYRGEGRQRDLVPLYLYEGERIFLRSDRLGIKLAASADDEVDVVLRRRVEGFPLDRMPPALRGLTPRNGGLDAGLIWRHRWGSSRFYTAAYQDVGHQSRGREVELGAFTDWRLGRWTVRPSLAITVRSARSNDFYYGVPAEQAALPERPAYQPGAGANLAAGLFGSYQLSAGWRLLGGVATTRHARTVRDSPIAERGTQLGVLLGAAYSPSAREVQWSAEASPTWVRVSYGPAAEDRCNMVKITTLRCTAINRATPTAAVGLNVGKTLVQDFRGWPLDLVGYVGLIQHRDRPFQRTGAEVDLFMKGFYRLPWSDRVSTRIGFGWGLSVADPVPFAEVQEQAARGRRTSRVLNYIDASVDFSVGDVLAAERWKHTYLGVGVVHRSGMFSHSRLLGNVTGGSNYIVLTLEHRFGSPAVE